MTVTSSGGVVGVGRVWKHVLLGVVADGVFDGRPRMLTALPLMRRRGPGIWPWLMALRTAVSAEPAPSVPMSRSAVKPAIRSSRAAIVAVIVRCGTIPERFADLRRRGGGTDARARRSEPGRSVVSPRSMISASWGRVSLAPTSRIVFPSTRISPGVVTWPDSTSSRRAA